MVAGIGAGCRSTGRWEVLGQREVDFRNDHDQIDVGRNEGQFKQLQFRVKDAPIEVTSMVVTFGNNQTTFTPKIRHRFTEGTGTHVIDLPGDRRTIKRIAFNYKSMSPRR